MTIPQDAQVLVDELIGKLGMRALRPSSIEIALDDQGFVQVITPKFTFRRSKKAVDAAEVLRRI